MIRIEPIDAGNVAQALVLRVHAAQRHYIETVKDSLLEARQAPFWKTVLIYEDEKPVGFAMYGRAPDGRVWLDRFLIDRRFQGKGLGRLTLIKLLGRLRSAYHCAAVYLSIYEENRVAWALYASLGFRLNGELDRNGEKVMVCEFDAE